LALVFSTPIPALANQSMSALKRLQLKHFPLFFLVVYTCPLIFLGFSDSVLQVDEGMDTFISTTILKFGIPVHSDGVNSSMRFADVYDGLFVYRPWIPYYAQAFSLSVFGQTTFAARLPFALIGVFSVFFFYRFALKFTGKPFTAFLAAFLLASSIPALIYFRTARYVGIPILLTVLLLYFYINIYNNKKWNPFPLTIVSIIFFHTMYVEFAGMIAGVLIHFFFHIKETLPENRKRAAWAAGITGVFCIPWFIFISPVFSHVSQHLASTSTLIDPSWQGFPKRFFGFLFQVNNYIFPFVLIPLLFLKRLLPFAKQISLLLLCSLTMLLTALPHSMPLQQYIISIFPLLFLLLAILLTNIFPKHPLLQSLLPTLLITTNLIHVGPLIPLKELVKDRPEWFQQSPYLKNVYASLIREVQFKSVYFDYLYELTHAYRGPLDAVVEFFKTRGKPGDSCYIDSEFESLAFYTGMKMIKNQDLIQHPPDWIIIRGKDRPFDTSGNIFPEARNVRETLQGNAYIRIELDAPAIWVNNTYDIQIHEFRSPSSVDRVTVYQRTDHSSNR
jgi:hypothetical protein